jgi:hypothetical protein
MKLLHSKLLSPFGGLNFVLEEFDRRGVGKIVNEHLPTLVQQSKYSWKDIFYSFWSVLFCGGDCAEDLSMNFRASLQANPFISLPSPDRILGRMKGLSEGKQVFSTVRGKCEHEFSINEQLNELNLKILRKIGSVDITKSHTLDYDNTNIFSEKSDAAMTYLKERGYCPGVGFIGRQVVYVENRNGNSDAQTLQQDTLGRMFRQLDKFDIKVEKFRADSASCQFSTLSVISQNTKTFYIRARMNETVSETISQIKNWQGIGAHNSDLMRGSVVFKPFEKIAERNNQENNIGLCRLVVTKEKRLDGQINLFTGEAFNYAAIITNDFDMTDDQIVFFYNQRGATEREFDVLKNDFSWNKLPFSSLEYNTVFLLVTAICRNLYDYIIRSFSIRYKKLSPHFRIKKFIFRFICLPARWVQSARIMKLRIYGSLQQIKT